MLSVHLCSFNDRRCETYGCHNHYGHAKYYIGRADVAVPKPVFCQSCVENMLANLPIEFAGVEAADKSAEIEKLHQAKLEKALFEQKNQLETVFKAQYSALLQAQTAPVEEEKAVEAAAPVETVKKYRCLDCGEDFEKSIQLATHKKKMHKEE